MGQVECVGEGVIEVSYFADGVKRGQRLSPHQLAQIQLAHESDLSDDDWTLAAAVTLGRQTAPITIGVKQVAPPQQLVWTAPSLPHPLAAFPTHLPVQIHAPITDLPSEPVHSSLSDSSSVPVPAHLHAPTASTSTHSRHCTVLFQFSLVVIIFSFLFAYGIGIHHNCLMMTNVRTH